MSATVPHLWPADHITCKAGQTGRYALNAFGLVPHMIFLVAFVAHGLGEGLDTRTRYWVLFGLGAMAGPVLLGHLADRIGARLVLRLILSFELVFVALPAVSSNVGALVVSSVIVGASTIGVMPVVLSYTRSIERDHPAQQVNAWRLATTSFALLQAAGAYFLSFVFERTGGHYQILFGMGVAAMAAGLLVAFLTPSGEEAE